MLVSSKVNLADARAELGLSQAALAFFAGISKQTVVNAENGVAIQRIKAHAILRFLNIKRQEAGKPVLSITDVDWRIVGE